MSKHFRIVTAAVVAALGTGAALADTTADFEVRILIENACDVDVTPPTNLDFGSRGLLNTDVVQQSAVSVLCTEGLAYDLALNAGVNDIGGGTTARRMINGANDVTYDLFQDSGRNQHWGDEIGTDTLSSTGTGVVQTWPVYGLVPAQDTPPAGLYLDTVTVTVTY